MLIVEGPDGGGKTTLAKMVSQGLGWPIAPRVVSKETEAMTDLRVWTTRNLADGFRHEVFDRHRLISDPVYRFCLPWKVIDTALYEVDWLESAMLRFQQINPIIIFCMPPLEFVMLNLYANEDNVKVREYADKIYHAYNLQWAYLSAWGDFNSLYWYDYTEEGSYHHLMGRLGTDLWTRGSTRTVR